jgi:hypothetical protein
MATGGRAATTDPAEISCQAATHCPRSEAIPVVIGFTVSLCSFWVELDELIRAKCALLPTIPCIVLDFI